MIKENLKNKVTELKEEFYKQEKKLRPKHLITRRIGSFHGFLFLITLLLGVGVKLTAVSLKIECDIPIIIFLSIWFVFTIGITCAVKSINSRLYSVNSAALILYLSALVTYKTTDVIVLLSGVFLVIYLGCYLSNKQHGYTRGWARNQTYAFLLESLEWEIEQLDETNDVFSELKLDDLKLKFLQIAQAQLHERQRDIIGDYLSTNDAAFSWIKSIKK